MHGQILQFGRRLQRQLLLCPSWQLAKMLRDKASQEPQLTISPVSLNFPLKTLFCRTGLEPAMLDLRSAA